MLNWKIYTSAIFSFFVCVRWRSLSVPFLFLMLGLAPFCSSLTAHCFWPLYAAQCNGVLPNRSVQSMFGGFSMASYVSMLEKQHIKHFWKCCYRTINTFGVSILTFVAKNYKLNVDVLLTGNKGTQNVRKHCKHIKREYTMKKGKEINPLG